MKKILYYSDFVLAPAFAIYFFLSGYEDSGVLPGFALGAFTWTFLEYILHRLAHEAAFKEHIRHHQKPTADSTPSIFLITPIALVAYFAAPVIFVSGLLASYSVFIFLHWSYHHLVITQDNPLYGSKKRHDAHHAGKRDTYGVTTRVWDWIFRKRP